ncbi:MAG: 3-5 exonuclease [Acidobacteriota bacterium]|jgi:DNA polymerase elongation subunit (family B)|nr:3-5 exonuclease [Acidobacteriota bacterium]
MIRHRTITIDCETLPAHTAEQTDEETVAHTNSSNLSPQPNAPATDDAATGTLSMARDGQRSSLNGDTGRLLCIGFIDEASGRRSVKGVLGWNRERGCFTDDETEILRDFWELMRTFRPCVDRIVGHNIYNFDLLFIYKRSVVCGVRPSIELNFARYRNQPIYDTMCEWEKWNLRDQISLDRLARVLSLESPKTNECHGSRIAELFARGEHKMIRDYCVKDVLTTRRIYRRMTFADAPPAKPTQVSEEQDGSRRMVVSSNFH